MQEIGTYIDGADLRLNPDELGLIVSLLEQEVGDDPDGSPAAAELLRQMGVLTRRAVDAKNLTPPLSHKRTTVGDLVPEKDLAALEADITPPLRLMRPRRAPPPLRMSHILGPEGMEERREEAEAEQASMPARRDPRRRPLSAYRRLDDPDSW